MSNKSVGYWVSGFALGIVFTLKIVVPQYINSSIAEDSNITLKEFKIAEGY